MRLIDADALKKLRHDYIQGRIKFDGNEYDLIDKCPTIEAEPVKRGRWEVYMWGKVLMCSTCKTTFHDEDGNGGSNYCPNCGAKMASEET